MSLVLDASAALAWIFERTDPGEARNANEYLAALKQEPGLVPALWHAEVLNALLVAQRRSVVSVSTATKFLSTLDRLPIETDDTAPSLRKEQIFSLGREYELSANDATYLDLALRRGAALATFDKKLKQACLDAGVALA